MKRVSLYTMRNNAAKYAWRIGVTGFNNKGDPYFLLLTKKEALESNPDMEYKSIYNPGVTLKGTL